MPSPISLQIPKFPLSYPTKTLARVSSISPNPTILHPRTSHYSKLHKTLVRAGHNLPAAAASSQISEASALQTSTASDVVKEFYDGINRRDLAAIEGLIAEDCVYEDLVFSQPFVGRKVINSPC